MNIVYKGKTALITGASSGIGRCFAQELAKKGSHLILAARSEDKLNELAEQLRSAYSIEAAVIPMDLAQSGAAEQLAEEVSRRSLHVDILINNAGFGTLNRFDRIEPARISQELQLNVASLTGLTHIFMQPMLRQGSGIVINVSSMTAFQPTPYMASYGAAKAYVLSFTEALWAENKDRGVQFLALCPGETHSSFHATSGADSLQGKKMEAIEVVNAAFEALERGQSCKIVGRSNYWMAQLPRILSRRFIVGYVERLFRTALKA